MENNTNNTQPPNLDSLVSFIRTQFQSGLHPDEIAQQLRAAGWGEDLIQQGFGQVQAQMMPNAAVQPNAAVATGSVQPLPVNVPKRGRMKTGWMLFKESWKILRSDKMLMRYVVMSALASMGVFVVYAIIIFVGRNIFLSSSVSTDASGVQTTNYSLTPLGYIPSFVYYVLSFFVINIYAAGLAANVLDLFHGQKLTYADYMKKAWSKAGPLFLFSVIEATVGMILRAISERSQLLGRIVIAFIGAAWSIARLFVVPIIVSTDEGAIPAIKDSTKMVISTWGENLVGRVSMGGVLGLFYMLIMVPISIALLVIGGVIGGIIGLFVALTLIIASLIVFSIVSTAASSILNTALYYYAKNRQIPPAFDAELLNSAFIVRKAGIFSRK
jgi:hypothetical protein